QTQGHDGFLVSPAKARQFIAKNKDSAAVLFPYMIGDDMLSYPPKPTRYVIDFHPRDILEASKFKDLIEHLKDNDVLKDREKGAEEEKIRNNEVAQADPEGRTNKHHANFLNKWWLLSYPRPELIRIIRKLPRYAACV